MFRLIHVSVNAYASVIYGICKLMLYQMRITAASLVTSCPVSETTVDPTAVLKRGIIDCQSERLWRRLFAMNGSYKTA